MSAELREKPPALETPRSGPPANRAGLTVWGLDVVRLHDLFWASHGVQVVRPGGEPPKPSGPQLYLLLREGEMALFPLDSAVEHLNWLKPRALRLRIVEVRPESYSERVLRGERSQFLGVRRTYRPDRTGAMRAGLTSFAAVASAWQGATSDRARRRALAQVGAGAGGRTASCQLRGRVFSASRPQDAPRLIAELQRTWIRPEIVVPNIYEFGPGIFLHESVEVEEDVRLMPPLWIGAGRSLPRGSLIAGPGVMDDETPVPPTTPSEVRWSEVYLPRWPDTWQSGLLRRRLAKRAFDIVFSIAVLIATAPIYPIVMAAILLEDGWPVFFVHRRQTLRGREFGCLKFRTMLRNADHLKAQLAAANQADGPQFFMADDPRLLRCGRWLRRLQIDELPQFVNVLMGHMSVVGPRPSPDKENQFCPAWREARLSVRPGVTGLWQVRRTRLPETDFQEWIRYDLEYVQRSSLRLDIWIIIQTVLRILGK